MLRRARHPSLSRHIRSSARRASPGPLLRRLASNHGRTSDRRGGQQPRSVQVGMPPGPRSVTVHNQGPGAPPRPATLVRRWQPAAPGVPDDDTVAGPGARKPDRAARARRCGRVAATWSDVVRRTPGDAGGVPVVVGASYRGQPRTAPRPQCVSENMAVARHDFWAVGGSGRDFGKLGQVCRPEDTSSVSG